MTMLENFMKQIVEQMFRKKVTLYLLPQIIWLCELYFLTMNALWQLFRLLVPSLSEVLDLPEKIFLYNHVLLDYLHEYEFFLMWIGLILYVSSYLIQLVAEYPLISRYTFIRTHAMYGQATAIWFFLTGFTYWVYFYVQAFFPGIIVLLFAMLYSHSKKTRW